MIRMSSPLKVRVPQPIERGDGLVEFGGDCRSLSHVLGGGGRIGWVLRNSAKVIGGGAGSKGMLDYTRAVISVKILLDRHLATFTDIRRHDYKPATADSFA